VPPHTVAVHLVPWGTQEKLRSDAEHLESPAKNRKASVFCFRNWLPVGLAPPYEGTKMIAEELPRLSPWLERAGEMACETWCR